MNHDPPWTEWEWVPVSALQHYCYCPRQCALIHVEQTFDENIYTIRGRSGHERADEATSRMEGGKQIERALPIWSDRYGIVGRADVVEFGPTGPYPIEYKHGARKHHLSDDVQLCAQALCLEEMFHCSVPVGAVYHMTSRQRREVSFTPELRTLVAEVILSVRSLLANPVLPPPVNDARCHHCSLNDSCLPGVVADKLRVQEIQSKLTDTEDDGGHE